MTEAERMALIHMLEAQRAQIDAALALLKPEPQAEEPPRVTERPVFGRPRTGG